MRWYNIALLCAVLVICVLDPILAKRTFGGGRHSYPKSGGLSGGGSHHSYPSSGGLSGGGHGYPSSGGSHGYPSSGGSHGYPSSGGLSGSGGRGYPSSGNTGSHGYPSSGNTGSHGYPSSGGLSGTGSHGKGPTHVTNVHNHYNYNPPKQITYASPHGGAPVSYPVYHGTPPTYVYQYKDSGSKYGTLLTGLALLNLGTLGTTAYLAATHNSGGGGHSSSYKAQPGEVCKFGIKKENGDYEETKIDCNLISSFIMQEEAKQHSNNNTTITTVTVTNVTMVNTTNGVPESAAPSNSTETAPASNPLYEMLPNGTLVPINVTATANATANATNEQTIANTIPASSVVVTSVTNTTTVTNALDVKGKDVEVTPGMKCYVIRNSPVSNMRKSVPCGLLQTYAEKSLKPNSAVRSVPTFTMAAVLIAAFVLY